MQEVIGQIKSLYASLIDKTKKNNDIRDSLNEEYCNLEQEQNTLKKDRHLLDQREKDVSHVESIVKTQSDTINLKKRIDKDMEELKTQRDAFEKYRDDEFKILANRKKDLDYVQKKLEEKGDILKVQFEELELEKKDYKVKILQKLQVDMKVG